MNDDMAYPGLDGTDAVDRAEMSERNLRNTRESGSDTYISPVEPPPRLAVDAKGFVWRVFSDGTWSMAPSNPDNEPIPQPVTYYVPADNQEEAR